MMSRIREVINHYIYIELLAPLPRRSLPVARSPPRPLSPLFPCQTGRTSRGPSLASSQALPGVSFRVTLASPVRCSLQVASRPLF